MPVSNAGCAVGPDGLKDASEIDFFHDPDDDIPLEPVVPTRRSSRVKKPSEKVSQMETSEAQATVQKRPAENVSGYQFPHL